MPPATLATPELARPAELDFVPLRGRDDEWNWRMRSIETATRFVYVTSYFLEPDEFGLGFLDALEAALRRGVQVFLGLDQFGQNLGNYARPAEERLRLQGRLSRLVTLGATVAHYRAPRVLQRWLGAGQHVKIQVTDEGQLLVASSNLTRRSFAGWNEFGALLRGPLIPDLLEEVLGLFEELPPEAAKAVAWLRQQARVQAPMSPRWEYQLVDPNRGAGALHPLLPRDNDITTRLVQKIDAATARVGVTSFHCKPTPPLRDALLRAATRGVHVELFHSHPSALKESDVPWLGAAFEYGRLLRAGIRIHEVTSGEHSKLFLVDDAWAAFGSYNAEHAAHERLAEVLVGSESREVVRVVTEVFDELRRGEASRLVHTTRIPLLRWLWWPLRRWI